MSRPTRNIANRDLRYFAYIYAMRKHNGMRPQDVVILLKIICLSPKNWQIIELSRELFISQSEVSESLNRSVLGDLIDQGKRKVKRRALLEFLQFGLHHVFPQRPGPMMNGIPTAHSHPFMTQYFPSEMMYVWSDNREKERGLSIEPLYAKQTDAVKIDAKLYKLLALIDIIRVGRARELQIAMNELKTEIMYESSNEHYADKSSI